MMRYIFDIEVKVPTPALMDSRSIPKMDSRLLIASRDPPIGTPIEKVGGIVRTTPDIQALKQKDAYGWSAFLGPLRLLNSCARVDQNLEHQWGGGGVGADVETDGEGNPVITVTTSDRPPTAENAGIRVDGGALTARDRQGTRIPQVVHRFFYTRPSRTPVLVSCYRETPF